MSKTEKIIAMLESERDAIEDEWGPGYAGGIEAAIAYLRTPDSQTEEALRKEIDRLGDHISDQGREIARLVNENHKMKRELADTRTPEGQEMYAVEHQGTKHLVKTHWLKRIIDTEVNQNNNDSQHEVFKVVPVIVTKKED